MDHKFLCVMAGYDEKTESSLASLQNELYKKGFTGEQTKDIPQHITLGTFDVSRESEIKALVKQVAEKIQSFPVTFNHVGIFCGSKVLFVAPDTDQRLLELKESFGESYGWTPHSTMLIDQPEAIYQAMPIAAEHFKAFEGWIKYIYLYEFWPTRLISCEKLSVD